MSVFTSKTKYKLNTFLDNAGQILGIQRLEEENLFDYKARLIDHVRNRGNASTDKLNYSFAREVGEERAHVLTIEPRESITIESPIIKVTSKYLKLYDGDKLDIQIDLYKKTIGDLQLVIDNTSELYETTYYNEDYQDKLATHLFYGTNLRLQSFEQLQPTKLNILEHNHIRKIFFSSSLHLRSRESLDDLVDNEDYYLDNNEGFLYTYIDGNDIISYLYHEIPYKLYHTPVSFYPMNDEDIDLIIKDIFYTEDGDENLLLNSKGADWINELYDQHPYLWKP